MSVAAAVGYPESRRTRLSWRSLRRAVFERDGGICQACLCRVGKVWDAGHLVDRIVGGSDTLTNLYLSCVHCNRTVKPIHRTLAEARAWLAEQQQRARTGREVTADWEPFVKAMLAR